jgi:hypothetical protein
MARQTLVQAVHLALTGRSRDLARAAWVLDGKPIGGWPETQQAWREVVNELPFRHDRSYTVDHFVDAMYERDGSRYRRRDADGARQEAARIEAASATLSHVRYWSVYDQVWATAHAQCEIPDDEWAAADEATRSEFLRLPRVPR